MIKYFQRRRIKKSETAAHVRVMIVVLLALFIVPAAAYFTGKEPGITMAMSNQSEATNEDTLKHDSDVSANTETATFAMG